MFSLSSLKAMEVIDIKSGYRLGFIKDMILDCSESKVISIVVPSQKPIWFSKTKDIEISWDRITKIGIDVILVDAADLFDIND